MWRLMVIHNCSVPTRCNWSFHKNYQPGPSTIRVLNQGKFFMNQKSFGIKTENILRMLRLIFRKYVLKVLWFRHKHHSRAIFFDMYATFCHNFFLWILYQFMSKFQFSIVLCWVFFYKTSLYTQSSLLACFCPPI